MVFRQLNQVLGALAVAKCGVKQLDFRHVFEYFVLENIKQRTLESTAL